VIVGTATVINGFYSAPMTTLAGVAVMAAGIPLYFYFVAASQQPIATS